MHQGVRPIPPSKLKKETTTRWNQSPKYENGFNGYCFSCSNFGHKAMDCRLYEKSAGSPNDKAVGHVTKIDILLLLVTH